MDMSGMIKKAAFAMALVLFIGQPALMAQSQSEVEGLIRIEKYADAQSMLEKLIGAEPRNDKYDYLMGKVMFLTDNMSEAEAWFKKGQGHSGRNAMNFIGSGSVSARQENFAKADKELKEALELNTKNDPKIILGVAKGYLEYNGKDRQKMQPYLNAAEPLLIRAQKLAPNDPEPEILLGELYGKQGVEELEQNRYEQAIAKDPKYIFGYLRLGQLYKKQEKYQEAADMFQKALEIDKGYGPVYREMAEMWTLAGKYDKAEESMTKYLEIMGSDDVNALEKKGIIEYLGNQFEKAIVTFEGIAGKTKSLIVPRLLGYCYVKQATPNADKGIEWLDKYFEATKASPKNIIASDYENYGKALQLKGQTEEAIAYYEKAIAKAAEKEDAEVDGTLYMVISDIYKEQGNDSLRITYLRKFLTSSSKYQLKESFALGQAYFLLQDYAHSDSMFAEMSEKLPNLHIGWAWRARANAAMDPDSKEGKALPYYQKVVELLEAEPEKAVKYEKDYLLALRYMGAYYTLTNENFELAAPFWQKILDVSPEDEGAKNGMDFIKQNGG